MVQFAIETIALHCVDKRTTLSTLTTQQESKMKRSNTVLNRRQVRQGRNLAKWMASRQIGDVAIAATVQRQCRSIVSSPALCQAMAQASDKLADEMGVLGGYVTQTMVHACVAVVADGDHSLRLALLAPQCGEEPTYSTEYVPIDHPDGGHRRVDVYPCGAEYNCGYRAGGTWVDGWWTGGTMPE